MTERDVAIGRLRIRVREQGDGPALILVHGLGADRRIWQGAMSAFADRWRVVAFDLPGHGASDKPDAAYTPTYFAAVVVELARALRIDAAVLVGSSLGGRIVLQLAGMQPELVRAFMLSAPAPVMGRAWAPLGALLPRVGAPLWVHRILPAGVHRGFFDARVPGAVLRRTIIAEQIARPDYPAFARAIAGCLAGLVGGPPPAWERARQPASIVWGREDRVVSPAGVDALRRALPQARVHLLDRCGHMPMLECPDAFHTVLEEFLAATPVRPARMLAAAGR